MEQLTGHGGEMNPMSGGNGRSLVGLVLMGLLFLLNPLQTDGQTVLSPAQEAFKEGFAYHTGEDGTQDLKRALLFYHKVLKVDPDLFPALYNAALIYTDQKENAHAQRMFIKAARAARKSGDMAAQYEALARNGLGACLQRDGKMPEAEKQFGIAIRMNPALVEAHYNLINILAKEKREAEVEKAIRVAEKLAPSSRYEVLKGRQKAQESGGGTKAVGGTVGIVTILGAILIYALYLRMRRSS
ncbi:MAG: tetratricopeptide repeat protein [Gemmatimonadetes bacterium]|nr:tetratricopeptide repeat protein [Gemmatimonadota bacterium]